MFALAGRKSKCFQGFILKSAHVYLVGPHFSGFPLKVNWSFIHSVVWIWATGVFLRVSLCSFTTFKEKSLKVRKLYRVPPSPTDASQMHPRLEEEEEEKKRGVERWTDRGVNERWWRRARMNSNHEYISPRLLRPDRFSGGGARWSALNTLRVVCGDGLMCEWMEEFESALLFCSGSGLMEGRAEGWIFQSEPIDFLQGSVRVL